MKGGYIYTLFDPENPSLKTSVDQLHTFLKHRQKLTCNRQYGKGIISGLDLEFGANHTITIKEGFGFTSQGLPIEHPETVYTHFTPYTPPPFPSGLSALLQLDPKNSKNFSFYQSMGVCRLIKEDEADKDNDTHLKNKEDISGFVATLILEARVKKASKDNPESILELKVVPLLVPKENPVFEETLPGLFFFQRTLRFNPRKGEIQSGEDILVYFLGLISNGHLSLLQDNLVRVWNFYTPLLGIKENNPFSELHLEGLLASYKSEQALKIMAQYLVGFIQDLYMAFTEFLEKAKSAIDAHQIDPFPFPLHLALGPAENAKQEPEKKYRHFFQQSLHPTGQPNTIEETAFLLKRLGRMISSFFWDGIDFTSKIFITPSTFGKVPLAERAIPFYYDYRKLKDHWKFTEKADSFPYYCPMGYFSEYEMEADPWINGPLDYDLEPYNFFRIEGHIGKDYPTALHQLSFIKSEYSLPFHLLALSASDFAALLHDEKKALKGIEHKAGVTKGGTFILVFNDIKSDQPTNEQEQVSKGDLYAESDQSLGELDIPGGEDGEKIKGALSKKYVKTNEEADRLPDQVVIADFCLPYYLDYKQPRST